jgi:F-type H+-transporting ATPase subunit a
MAQEAGETEVQAHEGAEGGGHSALPEALLVAGKYQPTAMAWITLFVILILCLLGLTRKKKIPGPLQGAWEFFYEWLEEIVLQVMGPKGMDFFPLFFSFFLFIMMGNLLGLVPLMASPTAKLDTTVALALTTFCSIHVLGMRQKGVLGYWGHFFHVVDASQSKGLMKIIMLPLQFVLLPAIELISELARPLSLSMRLFGNIVAKEILLAVLASVLLTFYLAPGPVNKLLMVVPLLLRPAILLLGVLVSIIQAVVFTVLSMVYISGAVAVHEGHEEHGHGNEHSKVEEV